MTDRDRVLAEFVDGWRLHQVLDVSQYALETNLPPSFQFNYNGESFLLLPYLVDGELRIEVFGFDSEGRQRQHLHLTLTGHAG